MGLLCRRDALCLLVLVLACDEPTASEPTDDGGTREFACKLKQYGAPVAIASSALCDGVVDCFSAEDERECGDKQVLCMPEETGDAWSVAVDEQLCDGRQDCTYFAEDERDCPDSFLCILHDSPGVLVIPRANVCDGIWDCYSDELDCPDVEAFTCGNGRRIPLANKCDQREHCSDGSDESPELCGHFKCSKGAGLDGRTPDCDSCKPEYVPQKQRCDGARDCLFGEDEEGC